MITRENNLDCGHINELEQRLGVDNSVIRRPVNWEKTPSPPPQKADAIVITDTTGRITLANGAALNFLQPSELFTRRKTCDMLLVEGLDCPHKALSQEHSSIERDIPSRAGDRLLNIRASNLKNAEGGVCGFVHVIREGAEDRAFGRPSVQVERLTLIGLKVSAVAHEVATPLSVIANIAEMLLLDSEQGSSTALKLEKIVTQTRRVAQMTRRMLDCVRQKPGQFTTVNMAELTRETLDLVEYELRNARVQASVESSLDTPSVWGDRDQLQQVLLNLITNAMQAMKNGGLLRVRIAEDADAAKNGRTVLLNFEDTGPGIIAQEMERMFDFFFTTKVAEGGTGLGLAVSRQIIEGHGGTITAENINRGGARISIKLPSAFIEQADAPRGLAAVTRA
jgi:signal transduction histidine kinase